jgi:hypothetical protein
MGNNGGRLGPLRISSLAPGDISITDNLDYVRDVLIQNPYPNAMVKVLDLEQDSPTLPLEHPNVLGGRILLPPIDALIAEQDGDENRYNAIYTKYFQEQSVSAFMEAVISALLLGTTMILYLPNHEGFATPRKLMDVVGYLYGIHIGVAGEVPAQYEVGDVNCVKCWLCGAYKNNALSPREFLYLYPTAQDNPEMINKLIYDIGLVDNNPLEALNRISLQLKEKPNLIVPIFHSDYIFLE